MPRNDLRTRSGVFLGTHGAGKQIVAGRLTGVSNRKSTGDTVSSFAYSYDQAGNRTGVVEAGDVRTTWAYDHTYQLTHEHRSGHYAFNVTYTYDAAGNRLLEEDSGARTTCAYDAANQLLTAEDASGLTTYTHDAAGNRTEKETPAATTYYAWDEDNRMVAAEPPAGTVTMTYTAAGARVKKETTTETKRFLYDFNNLLAELDGSDATEVLYTQTTEEYGDLVSEHDPGSASSTYWHYDALGSADALLDDDETVTDRLAYRAFGLVESHDPTSGALPHTFVARQGYYRDNELDLYLLGAASGGRHYDPATGRFTCTDRIRDDVNEYRYVFNRPLVGSDPNGLTGELIVPPTATWDPSMAAPGTPGHTPTPPAPPVVTPHLPMGPPMLPPNGVATVLPPPQFRMPLDGGVYDVPRCCDDSMMIPAWEFVKTFPGALWDSLVTGKSADSGDAVAAKVVDNATGMVDWFVQWVAPEFEIPKYRDHWTPRFGNHEAYQNAQSLGDLTVLFQNLAMLRSGLLGLSSALRSAANPKLWTGIFEFTLGFRGISAGGAAVIGISISVNVERIICVGGQVVLAIGINATKLGPVLDAIKNALMSGTGETPGGGKKLVRYGSPDSVEKLAADAAAAEAKLGYHGVSAILRNPPKFPHGQADFGEAAKVFKIIKTGNNPSHYTVILPNAASLRSAATKEFVVQSGYKKGVHPG